MRLLGKGWAEREQLWDPALPAVLSQLWHVWHEEHLNETRNNVAHTRHSKATWVKKLGLLLQW